MFLTNENIEQYKTSAENGDAHSQLYLGLAYWDGDVVDQNYQNAVLWFKKAIKKRNPGAYYLMGLAYFNGHGVTNSYKKSFKCFMQAAKIIGHPDAYVRIGKAYELGLGIAQDYNLAYHWYFSATKKEYELAYISLGLLYLNINWKDHNSTKAFNWLYKSAANNNIEAMIRIAMMYKNGEGVTKDVNNSIKWLEKASKVGQRYAKYLYAKIHNIELLDDHLLNDFLYSKSFKSIIKDVKKNSPQIIETKKGELFNH